MSSSAQLTTYHSYRTVKMEGSEQPTDSDEQSGSGVIDPPPQVPLPTSAK